MADINVPSRYGQSTFQQKLLFLIVKRCSRCTSGIYIPVEIVISYSQCSLQQLSVDLHSSRNRYFLQPFSSLRQAMFHLHSSRNRYFLQPVAKPVQNVVIYIPVEIVTSYSRGACRSVRTIYIPVEIVTSYSLYTTISWLQRQLFYIDYQLIADINYC